MEFRVKKRSVPEMAELTDRKLQADQFTQCLTQL